MYGEIICKLLEAAVDTMSSSNMAVPLQYKTIAINLGRHMGHTYAAKQFHDNNAEQYDTVIVYSLPHSKHDYYPTYKTTPLNNFINYFMGYRSLASDSDELVIIFDGCAPTQYNDTTYDLLSALPNLRAIINLQ